MPFDTTRLEQLTLDGYGDVTEVIQSLLSRLHGCYANGGTCDEATVQEIVQEFAPDFKF